MSGGENVIAGIGAAAAVAVGAVGAVGESVADVVSTRELASSSHDAIAISDVLSVSASAIAHSPRRRRSVSRASLAARARSPRNVSSGV